MQSTKVLAAGIVVLLAVGGVAAADTGVGTQTPNSDAGSVTNVNAYAAYENGTVAVTVTDAGEPLENVSVFVAEERVGTTDANGTATFDTTATEELELELAGDQFEAELEYTVEDGSLRLVEEEYEYQRGDEMAGDEHESEENEDDEHESEENEDDEHESEENEEGEDEHESEENEDDDRDEDGEDEDEEYEDDDEDEEYEDDDDGDDGEDDDYDDDE